MRDGDEIELDPDAPDALTAVLLANPTRKPKDDFTTPDLKPNTIFYLAIIKPHIDTWRLIGPVKAFKHLLPAIEDIVSDSPSAIDKLELLRTIEDVWGDTEPNYEFAEKGFRTFIVEGQRGVYTVLRVFTEVNEEVVETLPSPVYTVVRAGPLKTAEVAGHAWNTELVGSFAGRKDARGAAMKAMREMVKGKVGVKISEDWEKGKGGGVLIAMSVEQKWEVSVRYEDQVFKRAKEGLERDGKSVDWRL